MFINDIVLSANNAEEVNEMLQEISINNEMLCK